jgi:hypothetical protein
MTDEEDNDSPDDLVEADFEEAGTHNAVGGAFEDIETTLPDGGLRDDDIDLRSPETE